MGRFASGKYAKAISDRSGLEFPYTETLQVLTHPLQKLIDLHIKLYLIRQLQVRLHNILYKDL